jgi:iron complex outermembrane recepter protein
VNSLGLRTPITASFKGVRLPFAPKLQYSVRADYDMPVSERLNVFVGIGVNGQTKSIGTLVLPGTDSFGVDPSLYKLKGYALVDGNIGIHSHDNKWKLTIWGKNLFNKYYWTNSIQAYDTVVRYAGRPAEYGATLGFKF